MCVCIMVCKLLLIFRVLGAPNFAVFGYISLCSRSMSLTLRLHSSTGLNPVSMLIVSCVASVLDAFAMNISSFSFVGILMGLLSGL